MFSAGVIANMKKRKKEVKITWHDCSMLQMYTRFFCKLSSPLNDEATNIKLRMCYTHMYIFFSFSFYTCLNKNIIYIYKQWYNIQSQIKQTRGELKKMQLKTLLMKFETWKLNVYLCLYIFTCLLDCCYVGGWRCSWRYFEVHKKCTFVCS